MTVLSTHTAEAMPTPLAKGADMGSIAPTERDVIGGVDTHQDLHTAAVIDTDGTVLEVRSFSTTRAGYRAILAWMREQGTCSGWAWSRPGAMGPDSPGTSRSRGCRSLR